MSSQWESPLAEQERAATAAISKRLALLCFLLFFVLIPLGASFEVWVSTALIGIALIVLPQLRRLLPPHDRVGP